MLLQIQFDELRTKTRQNAETLWVWFAPDAPTKVIPVFKVGLRTQPMGHAAVDALVKVLAPDSLPAFTSDGLQLYFYFLAHALYAIGVLLRNPELSPINRWSADRRRRPARRPRPPGAEARPVGGHPTNTTRALAKRETDAGWTITRQGGKAVDVCCPDCQEMAKANGRKPAIPTKGRRAKAE